MNASSTPAELNRIGVDIGGTFTDTLLVTAENRIVTAKTPTTDDLITGIINGLERVCETAGLEPSDIDTFSHGSTIAVNALIEETGAKTALVTTAGFRDVLEIGEMYRDGSLLYNPRGDHSPPLVPRRYRYGVSERIDADGQVVTPLAVDDVDSICDDLSREKIESVAVCFLHSYANPDHERTAAARIKERLPDVAVSTSASISPEIREYSRTSTTVADAYVKPRVSDYLNRLDTALTARDVETTPEIMKSDGGVARAQVAADRPSSQLLSGPVAGVEAARFVGDKLGDGNLITFDMGGTSCDVAVVDDGDAVETSHRNVQGMKINGPFVNITTIGAGGGSIAHVTDVGALRVGPASAGATPGPACYGRGGTRPTVTDANLVLGILNPDRFGGDDQHLDEKAAQQSIREHIADPLGMTIPDAASAIKSVTDAKLASAVRVTAVKHGYDPREFTLMGFGGAGPMHACNVARELGLRTVVFPHNPGLLSALGVLVADIRHESVRSVVESLESVSPTEISELVTDAVQTHDDRLDAENVAPAHRTLNVSFDMRYSGQAHNLNIELDEDVRTASAFSETTLQDAAKAFEADHEQQYGFVDDRNAIELVNVRVTAFGRLPDPRLAAASPDEKDTDPQRGTRTVRTEQETAEVPYYDWAAIPRGFDLSGPAIIEMTDSTVWLPSDYDATVDQYRTLIATRTSASPSPK